MHLTEKGRKLIGAYERLKEERVRGLLKGQSVERLSEGLEDVIKLLMRERRATGNPCLGCGAYYARECISRAQGHPCAAS